MAELHISLLGTFHVQVGDRSLSPFRTIKEQALFIYLVTEAAAAPAVMHPRETLVDLLWSGLPLSSGRANLRQTLYQLRQAIPFQESGNGPRALELLASSRLAVGVNTDYAYFLDVAEFLRRVALNQLEQAVAHYQGDFLADFFVPDSSEFEAWATAWRSKLRRQALDALDTLSARCLLQGRFRQAERCARRQLEIDDLQERAHCHLMEALARLGQRSLALEQYQICRRTLAEELGIAPTQDTEDLHQRIKAGQLAAIKAQLDGISGGDITEGGVLVAAESPGPQAPPFVARHRELAYLGTALRTAISGQGQVRFVIGGAGRGKTALVDEFARRALASDDHLLAVTGYCRDQPGFGDPYAPFREVLAQLTGFVDPEANRFAGLQKRARRLQAVVARCITLLLHHGPDLIDSFIPRSRLLQQALEQCGPQSPCLRQLRAWKTPPYQEHLRQDRLFGQVTAFLQGVAAEQPLLLILEDLHLADAASVALLFHLTQAIQAYPILLIGTYRPEEMIPCGAGVTAALTTITGELKRRHGDVWLDLAQKSEEEERHFVNALIDSEPNCLEEEFRRRFYAVTGGHALFAVELLHTLRVRGDLRQDEHGRWAAAGKIDWQTLPARAEGVMEQRIGRLDPTLRRALTIASVEGEIFTAEIIALVQNLDTSAVVRRLSTEAASLHRLVKAEAVTAVGEQRFSRYRFRHQLFRQYLYQALDETEQTYLHEQVGRAMQALHGPQADREATHLAWHFEQANLAAPATDYLSEAARQAARLGANDQVIAHCTRGLALLEELPRSAQNTRRELALRVLLGNAYIATRGFGSDQVHAAFQRAYDLCGKVGRAPQLSAVLSGLWGYHIHQADYRLAFELASQALDVAQQQEPDSSLNAHSLLGVTLFYLGQFSASLEHNERVIERYDAAQHDRTGFLYGDYPHLQALSIAALDLLLLGYVDQALACSHRAEQIARQRANPFELAFTLLLRLWFYAFRYDLSAVLELAEEQIALTSRHGFPVQLAIAQFDAHWARGLLGEAQASILPMQRALADWEATGAHVGKSALLGGLAEVCLEAGRIEEGLDYAAAALAYGQATGERCYEAYAYRIRGKLLWAQGSARHRAVADFKRAMQVAGRQDARLPQLRATVDLCRLWRQQGKLKMARQTLAQTAGRFSESAHEPLLLQARQLLDELASAEAGQHEPGIPR